MKHNRMIKIVTLLLAVVIAATAVLAATNPEEKSNSTPQKTVKDYSEKKPEVTGEKAVLEDMELAAKEWFEYVDYEFSEEQTIEENGVKYLYRFYAPKDYGNSSIMAIRDYNPISTTPKDGLDINWDKDIDHLLGLTITGSTGVVLAGGSNIGITSGITNSIIAGTANGVFKDAAGVAKNAMYYARPEFMGIPGTEWNGVSKTGFFSASSITIQMDETNAYSVAKTSTINSEYTISGESKASVSAGIPEIVEIDGEITSSASSALGYGVDFQQNQAVDRTQSVSRTFDARTDEKVAGVGWKLCEYIVRVPYMVECYRIDGSENQLIETTYINYDLLSGVCRVYANGYIEHWNTGKLVNYADFFEGFITSEQLIEKAKGGNAQ